MIPTKAMSPLTATAAAVVAYKRTRKIINYKYQTEADDIVGKMTIAALDRELLGLSDPAVVIGMPNYGPHLGFAVRSSSAPPPPPPFSMSATVSAIHAASSFEACELPM